MSKPTKAAEPPRRAAGYIRISALMGREQGNDLLSDTIQREKIEAWAAYRGFRVVQWYIDLDVSGREGSRRPEFEKMMRAAAEHRFEVVAVYRLTRFARSVRQAAESYSALRNLGVDLVSCTEDIDTTTASGKFMQNMLFAMAEFESERISEEWKNVHANRRSRGIAHVPRPVTGYRQEKGNATLDAIEPVEAQAIRKIFLMRSQGLGYGEIRNALRTEGYVSRNGHSAFSQSTISGILKNPIYAGLLRGKDGELVEAKHEAIVPRDLWEKVQTASPHVTRLNRHHGALLSGLLVCSSCGYRMHFEQSKRRSASGYVQPAAYRCAGRQRADGCVNPMHVHAEYAEEYVEAAFLSRFTSSRMPHGGKLKATRQQKEWSGRIGKMRQRIDELDRALDGLADQRFVKGTLAADEYDRQTARFLNERTEVEAQMLDLERLVSQVRPIERDVLSLWPQLTVTVKRRALRIGIAEVRVLPSPRRGRGQRQFMPDRLQIGWLQ